VPKLKPATEVQRRDAILDAAAACFSRAGFHRTTVQDICKEANVSPGALYIYFSSKEDIIVGLCERDRAEFADRFRDLGQATDFMSALDHIATHYFVDDPVEKRRFVVEMGLEATRNRRVAESFHATDKFCLSEFEALFARLKAEGRIAPALDTQTLAFVFQLIGDGLNWRRAIHQEGEDAAALLPAALQLAQLLINPVASPERTDRSSALSPSPEKTEAKP
jgi:TetR/AcrR family transcriptional regulator, repressor for uid operon